MSKQLHYNLDSIKSCAPNSIYYLIFGEKSNGKSYQVKHKEGVLHFLETGKKFILLRRWVADITNSWIEKYFSDVDVEKITDGKYNSITCYRKDLYFSNIDSNTLKVKRGQKIGCVMALSTEQHYSGASFLDYDRIIFEEFMERGAYIPHESEKLQILYSTVDRKRGTTKVFCVGNTISRICPYLVDWNLLETIKKMKQGDIKIIETESYYEVGENEYPVTIAVEYCKSSGGNALAFGKSKTMIDSGAWQAREQPKLTFSKKLYTIISRIGFFFSGFKFIGELLQKDDSLIWFIYPYNKEFTKNLIVISDKISENPNWYRDIYQIKLNEKARKLFDETFRECNIFYSDDLTGTDFKQSIDFLIKK